jgi:hypothetical protein
MRRVTCIEGVNARELDASDLIATKDPVDAGKLVNLISILTLVTGDVVHLAHAGAAGAGAAVPQGRGGAC